jgi:hypothetical protein
MAPMQRSTGLPGARWRAAAGRGRRRKLPGRLLGSGDQPSCFHARHDPGRRYRHGRDAAGGGDGIPSAAASPGRRGQLDQVPSRNHGNGLAPEIGGHPASRLGRRDPAMALPRPGHRSIVWRMRGEVQQPATHPQARLHVRAVCKTVGSAYVGSNPTPATPCENAPLAANSRASGAFRLYPSMCHLVTL